jgi:hypothetical protein
MPKVALAETLFDWERLIAAATEKGEGVPGLEGRLAELRATLERARELDALRQRLQAERQQATQDLDAARQHGDDLAVAVRGLLVAAFGPRFRGLVQFGVRPHSIRRRSPSSGKASEPSQD